MAKPYAKKFYNSKAWRKCREAYISKVFGLCEHCSDPGYIVDHIEEITPDNIDDPNITLNHENLQYLCTPCHNRKTFVKYSPVREGLRFDDEGNLIQINNKNNF
ncbi:HNH endonuclease [Bacillus manliponensis]|uniref:HNH endonuclease n=1 Tax=Bacillus manliponensis TaxID=574376 RepID=UPI00351368BB